MLQGSNRLDRSARFWAAERIIGLRDNDDVGDGGRGGGANRTGAVRHRRDVVEGVPHDHALMFQSQEGLEALFGGGGGSVPSSADEDSDEERGNRNLPRGEQSVNF